MDDTDTESEPENSLSQPCTHSASPPGENPTQVGTVSPSENPLEAIRTLQSLDLSVVQKDETLHDTIRDCCDLLFRFLDALFEADQDANADSYDVLGAFLNNSFLAILFQYRQIFRQIASCALVPAAAASTIICWVDVLLSKLGDVIALIAGHFRLVKSEESALPTLMTQSEDSKLQSAFQLPSKWTSVPAVIASETASPAAKRLALRLVFASYVMAPQLQKCHTWVATGVTPTEMLKLLQTHIERSPVSPKKDYNERDRLSYAMVITLFATVDGHVPDKEDSPQSFRPRTLSKLLEFIAVIMYPHGEQAASDFGSPLENLDVAQATLIHWNENMAFFWSAWDDQRIANSEYIVHLTTTWLCHLGEHAVDDSDETWKDRLSAALMQSMHALNHALLVLQCMLQSLNTGRAVSTSSSSVLYKTCWSIIQLLEGWSTEELQHPSVEHTCQALCSLFVGVGSAHQDVKIQNLVIEALTLVPTNTRSSVFRRFKDSVGVPFVSKIEHMLTNTKRKVIGVDYTPPTSDDVYSMKNLLNLLTLIWHSGTSGGIHRHTLFCFLSPLVKWLASEPRGSRPVRLLLDSLFTAFAALQELQSDASSFEDGKFGSCDNEALWQLAINWERSDIFVASAFANLVFLTSIDQLCGPLTSAEAWDYLRDVMLLILSRAYLEEDASLALIASPVICSALLRLLQSMDTPTARFCLSSPWTMNLASDLKHLFTDDNESKPDYNLTLAARMLLSGKALLQEISSKLQQGNNKNYFTELQLRSTSDNRLMLTRINKISRLMLVWSNNTSAAQDDL